LVIVARPVAAALPATASAGTRPVARVEFGQRLEPAGRVLSGAGQVLSISAAKGLGGYASLAAGLDAASKPALCMEYFQLRSKPEEIEQSFRSFEAEFRKFDWYVVPQIGLSMAVDGTPKDHYEHRVAAGEFDAQIAAVCRGLKAMNRPAYLRIGFEFNGPHNGYQPETYPAAFIRVTRALREAKLDQVATVWCADHGGDLAHYYPGDEFVDWFGVDLWKPGEFAATNQLLRAFLDFAQARRKPVMIGETTPQKLRTSAGEAVWRDWYSPFFALIDREPVIKAFCYINWNWDNTRWASWGDGRIEAHPLILERFQDKLRSPLYLHATASKEEFLSRCARVLSPPKEQPSRRGGNP
jgi:hypothetical protein